MDAAEMLQQARRASGLTQRELASRTGIPQSAIARIERRRQTPRLDTLQRLLKACGWTLRFSPDVTDGVDRSQVREWLRLDPAERARRAAGWGRATDAVRRARRVAS